MKKLSKFLLLFLSVAMLFGVVTFKTVSADEEVETVQAITRYTCPISVEPGEDYYSHSDTGDWCSYKPDWGPDTEGNFFDGYKCQRPIISGYGGYETAPYGNYTQQCRSLETYEVDHIYVAYGDKTWEIHHPEDAFLGYCFSHHLGGPKGLYDRVEGTDRNFVDGGILDRYQYGNTAPASSTGSFAEAFKTILYYGYPNDASGLQSKYGLTNSEFKWITHVLIWYYSDGWDYEANIRNRIPGVGQNVLNALSELYNKKYTDIPQTTRDKLKLYVYISRDGNQSTMGLASLQYTPRGGVNILKFDDSGNPIGGAEFGIYQGDTLVKRVTSNNDGLASVCEADELEGLPLGTYTVREITAPNGYVKSNDYFTFTISRDGEVVSKGSKNGGSEDWIKFINTPTNTANFGGIKIKKSDSKGGIANATYSVFNSSNQKVLDLVTNSRGEAESSPTALPVGSYTLKETEAPANYQLDPQTYPFTVSGNRTFAQILNLTDPPVEVTVDIPIQKNLYKYNSSGNTDKVDTLRRQYEFILYNVQGSNPTTGQLTLSEVARTTTDAEGKAEFKNIKMSGKSFDTYMIKEVVPNSCNEIMYDTKEVFLEIHNIDGKGVVLFEDGEAVFDNKEKTQDISGRIWLDANYDGIQDNNESPLENMPVCLFRTTKGNSNDAATTVAGLTLYPARDLEGNLVECQMTGSNGDYKFTNLDVGTYYVASQVGEKALITHKDIGNDAKDNDSEKIEDYAVIKNINATDWCSWTGYREFPHNDIGIVVTPEKFIYDVDYNDINNDTINQNEDIIYVIKFDSPFNYSKTFTFKDIIPEGTEFISCNPIKFLEGGAEKNEVYSYDEETRTITWQAEGVEAYSKMEVEFKVKATKAKNHPINDASVTFDNTTLWSNEVEAWVPNILVRKLGPNGEEEVPLAGAEIEVREQGSGKVIDSWVSDGKTDHYVKNLKFDVNYEVIEVKAPSGYVREQLTTHKFKIVRWEPSVTD